MQNKRLVEAALVLGLRLVSVKWRVARRSHWGAIPALCGMHAFWKSTIAPISVNVWAERSSGTPGAPMEWTFKVMNWPLTDCGSSTKDSAF